jgi:hypothetical protein
VLQKLDAAVLRGHPGFGARGDRLGHTRPERIVEGGQADVGQPLLGLLPLGGGDV